MIDPRFKVMRDVCNHCYKSTPEMHRGLDEPLEDWQTRRRGTGCDPKNRKKLCPHCSGTGRAQYCYVCGEKMPCGGRQQPDQDALDFEPGPCLRSGRSDPRTYREIVS